jgi:hypothetical protein
MIDAIHNFGQGLLAAGWWGELAWPVIWNLIKITVVLICPSWAQSRISHCGKES